MKCDCLNDCGDDPGLRDGRATPCDHLMARRVAYEKRVTTDKVLALVDTGPRGALREAIIELGKHAERTEFYRIAPP